MILDLEKCYGAWWWWRIKRGESVIIMVARLETWEPLQKLKQDIWFGDFKNQPAGIPPRSSRQIRFSNRQSSQLSKINIKLYVSIGITHSTFYFSWHTWTLHRWINFWQMVQIWPQMNFGKIKSWVFEVGKDTNRWIRTPVWTISISI